MEQGNHGIGFTSINTLFAKRRAKYDFHISVPVTLNFNLLTSELLCQLLLSWVTSHQSLNIVHCAVFELTVGVGRKTEGQGVTHNARS